MGLEAYEKEHLEILRKLAPECMVMLKEDGSFPLEKPGNIALYGNGVRHTIKGGTGSGDVNVRHYSSIEEGMKNAGFTITTTQWLDQYDQCRKQAEENFQARKAAAAKEKGIAGVFEYFGEVMPEPDYEIPITKEGKTAIYVLSRISGEGSDRKNVKGDFQLSDTELRDIRKIQKIYDAFLLVLNVGGVVDLTPIASEVQNILLLSQPGMTVGDSFADVILGKSYPSGKLSSTWAAYEEYCQIGDFAELYDTRYREGIYVGYRYFDSVGKKPVFPFGYGIGYTTFSVESGKMELHGSQVSLCAKVKNTGARSGKEVVQLYVSVPEGRLDQPLKILAAFQKTKELSSGEGQELILTFDLTDLASYDTKSHASILEAGAYVLWLGTDSRSVTACGVAELTQTVIVRSLSHVGGEADFIDWKPDQKIRKHKLSDIPKNLPVIEMDPMLLVGDTGVKQGKGKNISDGKADDKTARGRNAAQISAEEKEHIRQLVQFMTNEELACLCIGAFQDEGSKSFIGNAGITVAGAAGETCGEFENRGIGKVIMADGPAGIRIAPAYGKDEKGIYTIGDQMGEYLMQVLPKDVLEQFGFKDEPRSGEVFHQYCSAIPIGTALAQSFNEELVEECGNLVAEEMERFGIHLWLAPALNIHRNPLCGRNFEYYSEDPLVSGRIAAAISKGVEKHKGCGVTLKHFVCNNQETNRMYSNSIVSERALRDIYMKGFEIVVKECAPAAIMTSYNLLNGEHTSQRKDLLKTVLREEWGYQGTVMSDWVVFVSAFGKEQKYPGAKASGMIASGNDLMMPGSPTDYEELLKALDNREADYMVTREDLQGCAGSVLRLLARLAV